MRDIIIKKFRLRDVMVKAMDSGIEVSEFEL